MAEPAKFDPKAPGVLRGTATVSCTKTRRESREGVTTATTHYTERFDANYWVDFAAKVEAFRKVVEGRKCEARVIDISLDDQKPRTTPKADPKQPHAGGDDAYSRLRDQCLKAGRRDCDGQGR